MIDKFGPDFQGSDKHAFFKPSYKMNQWDFKRSVVNTNLKALYSSGLSKASLDGLACSKCGSDVRVEMHHVRMLADLNPKLSEVDKIMVKKRRKQVPLCRPCHMEHHKQITLNKHNTKNSQNYNKTRFSDRKSNRK